MSLTTRGRALLLAGLAVTAAGISLGLVDLAAVGILLLVLPVLAAWLVARRPDLRVSRVPAPARVPVDAAADVTLQLRNAGTRPSPVARVEDRLPYALGDSPRLLLPRLAAGEATGLTYRVRSHVRGRHELGPLVVRLADPFGLVERSQVVTGSATLTVLPRVVPLATSPGTAAGSGSQAASTHRLGLAGEDDPTVREYRSGDDLRRIHWPSTARVGDLMVRQDEEPGHRRALVVLDDRAAAHAGEGGAGSFEWAVSAAASVVALLVRDGYEVRLSRAAEADARPTGPAGLASADLALDVLAAVEPAPVESPAGLLDAIRDFRATGGGLVVAVLGDLGEAPDTRLRVARGSAIALVVERSGFLGEVGYGGGDEGALTAERLRLAGWRAAVATPSTRVADAWAQVTTSPVGMSA